MYFVSKVIAFVFCDSDLLLNFNIVLNPQYSEGKSLVNLRISMQSLRGFMLYIVKSVNIHHYYLSFSGLLYFSDLCTSQIRIWLQESGRVGIIVVCIYFFPKPIGIVCFIHVTLYIY